MGIFSLRGFRPAIYMILFCLLVFILLSPRAHAMPVFINELHYDNAGIDVGESVELAGLAGTCGFITAGMEKAMARGL